MRRWIAAALVAVALLAGCRSEDERARELHTRAITANREGRHDEARSLLERIVTDYPATETAVTANQALAASEAVQAVAADTRRKTIDMALQLYRLDNGMYPTSLQGLRALVRMPALEPLPRNWRAGGYVDSEATIEGVRYTAEGTTYTLDMEQAGP